MERKKDIQQEIYEKDLWKRDGLCILTVNAYIKVVDPHGHPIDGASLSVETLDYRQPWDSTYKYARKGRSDEAC